MLEGGEADEGFHLSSKDDHPSETRTLSMDASWYPARDARVANMDPETTSDTCAACSTLSDLGFGPQGLMLSADSVNISFYSALTVRAWPCSPLTHMPSRAPHCPVTQASVPASAGHFPRLVAALFALSLASQSHHAPALTAASAAHGGDLSTRHAFFFFFNPNDSQELHLNSEERNSTDSNLLPT